MNMVGEIAANHAGATVAVTLESGESFEGTVTEPVVHDADEHHHEEASFLFDGVDADAHESARDYATVRQIEVWNESKLDDPQLVYPADPARHIPSPDDEVLGVIESISVLSE